VPSSCKGRAVCPSCGGRRMAERAAHLLDHVFPPVPVRQWVLSLPHGIRYVLAWDHPLCRAVVGVFMRAVLGFLRRRARERQGVANGRGGAVAIIQRFGSALNLNVHVHALVVDGEDAEDGLGGLCCHPATPPQAISPLREDAFRAPCVKAFARGVSADTVDARVPKGGSSALCVRAHIYAVLRGGFAG
jgi:transposase-like zinc-binding protein/putative transposase